LLIAQRLLSFQTLLDHKNKYPRTTEGELHEKELQERNNKEIWNGNKDQNSFAACLLLKDDNHCVVEWIDSHYQVLPLWSLVVAIDPNSVTSPLPILRQWNCPTQFKPSYGQIMSFVYWYGSSFVHFCRRKESKQTV
jgi:hypothetical protein